MAVRPVFELTVLLGLYKPLAEHCSLFHLEVFWLAVDPFFEEISRESVYEM